MDPAHRREVDHEPVRSCSEARDVVTTAADGHLDAGVAAEVDRVSHVGRVRTACDEAGALVDQAVVDASGLFVTGRIGSEEFAAE